MAGSFAELLKRVDLIRACIRTAPLQQSVLHREINRRVRTRLAEAKVPYGPAIEAQFIKVL